MSNTVRNILTDLRGQVDAGQILVFSRGDRAFSGWTHGKKELDNRIIELTGTALPHWTLHDLRRTAATRMGDDLQIRPHVVEQILNHRSGHKSGIAGVYNYASYTAETTAALTMWANHIAA